MRFRRTLVLLLFAALIVLGALLPNMVGSRQDAADDGEIYFATINDIQLEFAESDVSLMETISILCGSYDSVEIPEELASLSRDKVTGLADIAARAYQEKGVAFQAEDGVLYGFDIVAAQPILAYSSSNDNQSNIFWFVNVIGFDRTQFMNLTIDDRTGTICSVDYSENDADYNKEQMRRIMEGFSEVYLAELGEEFYDFNSDDILSNAKSPLDNSYLASEISWWSNSYEYRTTFFVNTHGFYTYLAVVAY